MSFTITITNVPDKDLGPMLARIKLPRGARLDHKYSPDHVALLEGPPQFEVKPRATGDTVLTMTGKVPKSDLLKRALIEFEKVEAQDGIGTVTVKRYREYLTRKKLDHKLQTRLYHEGYLSYLR